MIGMSYRGALGRDELGIGTFDPKELLGIVVTAVAINAFVYGAILVSHGFTNLATVLLVLVAGAISLGSTAWLIVVSQVRQIVDS